jgi:hypothetical protein
MIKKLKKIVRNWILSFKIWNRKFSRDDRKKGRPQGRSADVNTALRIWSRVVLNAESDLLYNPVTDECYVEWFDTANPVYLFLESGRMRIVNTVIGYDVLLESGEESWCFEIFRREVNRRRNTFKTEALSKVVHSLDDLERRLIENEKQQKYEK